MECNKEEAIRAKEIAERKMQNKDYSGARKIALKAQQLYPDLENISQLILVCDVHLSAESMVDGKVKDWYGILKIESTADEASIKKQYRKLALLLHPDKNKFAGASDAFKFIVEAHGVLIDPAKRLLYNHTINKNSRLNPVPPRHQANKNPSGKKQTQSQFVGKTTTSFPKFATQQQQPQKPIRETFWTMCPYCTVKYQYYREVINKNFKCQRCEKTFTGYEFKNQTTAKPTPWSQPNQGFSKHTNGGKVGSQKNGSFESHKKESFAKMGTSEVGEGSNAKSKFFAKVGEKRKMQTNKSSETRDSDSIKREKNYFVERNGDAKSKQDFGSSSESYPKSTRAKMNISYSESLSDNGIESPSKKAKSKGTIRANERSVSEKDASTLNQFEKKENSMPMEEDNLNKVKQKEAMENGENTSGGPNGGISPDSSSDLSDVPEILECADPDFNDFEKDRREDCFTEGQVWALYDPLDAMPRFYARIRKVFTSSEFKLSISWLEADPDDDDEIKWVDAELPVSCGKYRNGDTENTRDRLMFSHRMDWEKGSKRNIFKIYPRKGETWALFKDWDMTWHSNPESKSKFEFEFVEILSDYCEQDGVSVAYLGKLKGFSCLFCRTTRGEMDSFRIPHHQLFRFSHRVPSFSLTGAEREGVPKDSFELDPASLPPNIVEIDIPFEPKPEVETVAISDESSQKTEKKTESDSVEKKTETESEGSSYYSIESPEAFEIPEAEFFNFDTEKSPENFHPGQFWALYSDEDGLPKYYAKIKNAVHNPEFKVHITWLNSCSSISYVDKDFPIGCGTFKHMKSSATSYTDTGSFSHLLRVDYTDKKDIYAIYPNKGEVWAVYKNWSLKMTCSDLENCEYDFVEVLEENESAFKGLVLEMVSGYKSVFKPHLRSDMSPVSIEIVRSEVLRFSHRVPAFRLTDQKSGGLRGYWEFDPAALPIEMVLK